MRLLVPLVGDMATAKCIPEDVVGKLNVPDAVEAVLLINSPLSLVYNLTSIPEVKVSSTLTVPSQ